MYRTAYRILYFLYGNVSHERVPRWVLKSTDDCSWIRKRINIYFLICIWNVSWKPHLSSYNPKTDFEIMFDVRFSQWAFPVLAQNRNISFDTYHTGKKYCSRTSILSRFTAHRRSFRNNNISAIISKHVHPTPIEINFTKFQRQSLSPQDDLHR